MRPHFFKKHQRAVVKPARGRTGAMASVWMCVRNRRLMQLSVKRVEFCPDVIVEELVEGEDCV